MWWWSRQRKKRPLLANTFYRRAPWAPAAYITGADVDELLSKLDGDGVIAVIAITSTALVFITFIAANTWQKVRRADVALALKRDMLGRGMTADDILAVLDAGSGKPARRCTV
jgi:hypothetical protein